MNIQLAQLKYLLALANVQSYKEAAIASNVSQPALSMAIKKLEDDLNLVIIDRKSNPIKLTDQGIIIAEQAKKILHELSILEQTATELKSDFLYGDISLGIIPTLAPYIIPLFIQAFGKAYPHVHLNIQEETTTSILKKLKNGELDAGLLSTPLDEKSLVYNTLFYEEFYLFSQNKIDKSYVLTEDIDFKHLWLLEESHCMRNQILNLCELRNLEKYNIKYNAGSIESLINITEVSEGMTIIPELATHRLSAERKEKVKPFEAPTPVREISIIYHKFTTKQKVINALQGVILDVIPSFMKVKETKVNLLDINAVV